MTTTSSESVDLSLYGGVDPREVGVYTVGEAARYLRLSPATLTTWVKGRHYPRSGSRAFSPPLIQLPEDGLLSFNNLIEAHVLRALRTREGIPMNAVRRALEYVEEVHRIDRLLLSERLRVARPHERKDPENRVGAIFLETYAEPINLSATGQLVIRRALNAHLDRVDRDLKGLPSRLYPFLSNYETREKPVLIDPTVSFGRPILAKRGIRLSTLADRYDAGESLDHLAEDYDLETSEVEEAIYYYAKAA